ncbi:MAG: 16S rRNA (uracil(1498)-N(3))-methyltransferase [Candidatus Aminicenantes bacterium]|nr:16S rRNA (uracil(1498)-N(3))-methyltransferase [Candidatus Aminicenantes bacterium]
MTSNQFFIKNLPDGRNRFSLEGEEHHHLFRVARIRVGDRIWLTDGRSHRLLAEVEKINEDKTWLRPLKTVEESLKTATVLGLGMTKPKTMDFIIQKATELGVTEIQPLITRRSLTITSEKLEAKTERWKKIAREALKQSKGAILPVISQPLSLKEAILKTRTELKLYLDEHSEVYFRDILSTSRPGSVSLLIGPEGGWTKEEEEMLQKSEYKGLTLGGRILRTETAVISALTLISHFWNW